MGYNLYRPPQEVPPPFLSNQRTVNLPGRRVGIRRAFDVDESFVIPQVEVGLCTVFSNVYFAVLIGGHRAGVDVQIRVELLYRHRDPSTFQYRAD